MLTLSAYFSRQAQIEEREVSSNATKLNNHVATLLVPSNRHARPLSNSYTSPTSLAAVANGIAASETRKDALLTNADLEHASSPQKLPVGPNHANATGQRVVSQPPPSRSYHPSPPPIKSSNSYNSGQSKPKLAVTVPPLKLFSKSSSPPRGAAIPASSPIPIRTSPTQQQTPAMTYAAHHSSSSGSCSDSDDDADDAGGLTIKKRQRTSHETPIDEDVESSLSHSISPVSPGLPATPPDSGGSHFFGSVRGRKAGGGRPLSMAFNSKQPQHYQTYQQKQANRQSRIPADPHVSRPSFLSC